ncbi:MAG: carboxylesterase family protein [Planctomycetes bacterium]|jgi:acetyl esterase/lipase|nr:carboxylesterase family protein [Planctomycetota bacterium]
MRIPCALLSVSLLLGSLAAQQCRFRDPVFPTVTRTNGIVYGNAINQFTNQPEDLLLDLYQPTGDTAAARPAFVVVHGGGFVGGSRGMGAMVGVCNRLASAGYVAISIDYRLGQAGIPTTPQVVQDAVHDFQAAVRWLRANAGTHRVDPTRIAALGGSAGAATVMSSAYTSTDEGNSGNPGFSSRVRMVVELWGALPVLDSMQAGEPPLFITHGTADQTVAFSEALALVARAQAVGLPYEFHPIVGAGHSAWTEFGQFYFDDALAFAWQHLDLAPLAGLSVRPGFASPGVVELDQHGLGGDFYVLGYSTGPANLPVPGVGLLGLDPAGLLVVGTSLLPTTARITTVTTTVPVPAGLGGTAAWWQGLEAGVIVRLTNALATPF